MTPRSADPPRVLHVASIDSTLVVLLWAQLRAAQAAGYDVRCASSPGPNRNWLNQHGAAHVAMDIRRRISPWADLRTLYRLCRYLRRERVTIVHTHTPKAALLGQLAAKLAGVPVVLNTLHGFYFHDDMPRLPRTFYTALAWIGGRCASMTLSQNDEDIDTAIRLGISRPDTIRFLGNGVDLTRFNPDRFDADFRRRKRAELGLPDGTFVVGMIGRLVVDKGYLELFEALRLLRTQGRVFHLLMIAPQESQRAGGLPADEYERFGLAGCTTRLDGRDDVDELLACMDIYVLPSWREGFPRSAIEAAAMGLPIVTTDVRGCREVVTDGVNGRLVPPRSPPALAQAIGELLADSEGRQRLGQAGRERARGEFDERVICRRVLDAYAELLKASGVSVPVPRPDLDDALPKRGPFRW